MSDATTKKIVVLLTSHPDAFVKAAAARLLAELSLKDKEVAAGLLKAVEDAEPSVRLEAIRALGKLGVESALARLVEFIKQGGAESEAAADAAAQLGARAVKSLQDLMHHVAPGLRRRIAGALAASGGSAAHSAGVHALLDSDPGVVDAAARSLLNRIPNFQAAEKRSVGEQVLEALAPRKGQGLAAVSEAALLRVLAGLHDARSEKIFWSRVDASFPESVRAAALQALGGLPLSIKKDQLVSLLACAADPNFRIAAPALLLLKPLEPTQITISAWASLFESADPSVRRFALEKLGSYESPPVLEGLRRQLRHPDRQLREMTLNCLAGSSSGMAVLVQELLEAESADETWSLARALAPILREADAVTQKRLLAEAGQRLESGDRRADPLVFVLREMDPKMLRDELETKALGLRKKKDYPRALVYLKLLTRDPACGEAIRFEMAACALKLSEKDLAAEHRALDPCLQQFARLAHHPQQQPIDLLRAAKWLTPEDYFYLGFHFVESSDRQERELGSALLELVQERCPKTKLAKDAKNKQRAAGL
ncbi:MAG TPA: HEAT repeat domain-containing protein [Gemmataceae bacterium]|jgi:HEAT repeat protein|nr:HEAT repeat domain-containing protein [Gemmataceae bacterium]